MPREYLICEERWIDTGEKVEAWIRPAFREELVKERGPTEWVPIGVEDRTVRVSVNVASLVANEIAAFILTVAAALLLRDKKA